jgi:tetratricopeptide (TPR) repeat protein
MNQGSSAAARLMRLERYLQEDPANAALLADACDAAIEAGEHAHALVHLAAAAGLGLDPQAWTFRRARLCIAQRDLERAGELLESLRAAMGQHPVLAHDLAYVAFLQDDFSRCRELLQPWLDDGTPGGAMPADELEALQVLCLRATHRLGLVQEGWTWARDRAAEGKLLPAAQGVASLLAIDADDFGAASALADTALDSHPLQGEALVARATVALAQRETSLAGKLLARALEGNADDGRTWSTLGFASLQAQDLERAETQFERALRTMTAHIGTWHALGWTRLLRQDLAGALRAFQEALALDHNFAESHGALGLVLGLRGDGAQAEHHLAVADRLDPQNVTGRYARALLKGEAGEVQRLQDWVARLLEGSVAKAPRT